MEVIGNFIISEKFSCATTLEGKREEHDNSKKFRDGEMICVHKNNNDCM